MSARSRQIILFFAISISLAYFTQRYPTTPNPNEYSRLYQIRAVVEDKSLIIDNMINRFLPLMDKSEYNGHFYSDKSFGLSMTAIPFYYAYYGLFGPCKDNEWMKYLLSLICVLTPNMIFIFMFYQRYIRSHTHRRVRELILAGYIFGTIVFTYSNLLYSHVTAGAFAGIAWILINTPISLKQNFKNSVCVTAGLLIGSTIILEYPSAIICGWIVIYFMANLLKSREQKGKIKPAFLFFTAMAIPLLIQFLVNYLSFDNPFSTGYAHKAKAVQEYYHSRGFFGVCFPSMESLWGVLLSPAKGVFYASPFFLFCFPVLITVIFDKKAEGRFESFILFAIIASFLLFGASVYDWQGGWTVGSRYCLSCIPFMAIALENKRFCGLFMGKKTQRVFFIIFFSMIIWGIAHVFIQTIAYPYIPEAFNIPLRQFSVPLLRKGYSSLNLGNLIGLGRSASIYLFLLIVFIIIAKTHFLKLKNLFNAKFILSFVVPIFLGLSCVCLTKFLPYDDDIERNIQLSYIYKNLNKTVDYINELYLIHKKLPADTEYHFNLALELRKNGFYTTAKKHFEQVLAKYPQHEQAESEIKSINNLLNLEHDKYGYVKSKQYEPDKNLLSDIMLLIRHGDYDKALIMLKKYELINPLEKSYKTIIRLIDIIARNGE